MKTPDNLLYTKEHEWALFGKDDVVVIGITDYAQNQLGDIIFIEFPQIGEHISSGDIFGEIEAVKTVSELYAPISGSIIEVNIALEEKPDLVNNDPFGGGWIIKINSTNPDEKKTLMDSNAYEEFVG
tara:strand:- start:2832 stop:3212 length:381 start_codon:yes stop_codon:yes gene_type:complete